MSHSSKHCIVCDLPLTHSELLLLGNSEAVCKSVFCQRLISQKDTMHPSAYKAHFDFQRKRIIEKRQQDQAKEKHKNSIVEKEQAETEYLVKEFTKNNPQYNTQNLPVVNLPIGLQTLAAMDDSRIEKYREHIQHCFEVASEYKDFSDIPEDQHKSSVVHAKTSERLYSEHPEVAEISDRFCTICKGGCCSEGANFAYISGVTIWRLLQRQPRLKADEVVTLYLDHLPEHSIEGSCINQTEKGCSLPKELRSDVCNGYYCSELQVFQKTYREEPLPTLVLAVQRTNTHWNRFDSKEGNTVIQVHVVE